MDLSTRYLGLQLPHPFVAGASPLADEVDGARRLEDGGAAAIVMRSLFAEQIEREQVASFLHTERHGESFAEALSFFPSHDRFSFGPEEYLEHIRKLKEAVRIPIIASLNGTTPGAWLEYAPLMAKAGADALELNLYRLALDPDISGAEVEDESIEVVRQVRKVVNIPMAVKISPFFSSLAHFARRLTQAGADGLVVFNRFYQPDIDPENLQVKETLQLSSSTELRLRLRWLAVLSADLNCSLAVTGGVHVGLDAVKAVMAGADAVQTVSALLQNGPARLAGMRREMEQWMAAHEWTSLSEMRGNMNMRRCPDPQVYERANYMLILQSWRVNA